jgi:hypothetical protein
LTVGRALFTCASATSVASTANAGKASAHSAAIAAPSRKKFRTKPIELPMEEGSPSRNQRTGKATRKTTIESLQCTLSPATHSTGDKINNQKQKNGSIPVLGETPEKYKRLPCHFRVIRSTRLASHIVHWSPIAQW